MAKIKSGKCRGCGAKIFWLKTESKKQWQPFDVKQEKRMIMVSNQYAKSVDEETLARMVPTYVPHHATCANVDMFRR